MLFSFSYWSKGAFPLINPFIFPVIKIYVLDLRWLKKKKMQIA